MPTDVARDPHERLREDVRLLGGILGDTLRQREGSALFHIVERVRALSKSGRAGSDRDLDALAELLRALPVESTMPRRWNESSSLNVNRPDASPKRKLSTMKVRSS